MLADPSPSGASGDPEPPPLAPIPYVVRSVTTETPDTVTLTIRPSATRRIATPRPGQFNMLYAFGVGESAISVSRASLEGELVHTVRRVGKVTNALSAVTPGDTVGVRGPYGRGWPIAEARGGDVVVIAGGLGLPPLRPAIYAILSQRESFGRVEVIYGARSPKDLVYYDEIQTWRRRTDVRFQTTVDAAGRDWYGDVGVVTTRLPDARFDPPKTTAFVCGPEIMMTLSAKALADRGVPRDRIWVSMERNMKCAVGLCGHCQFGPSFVCRDGPVLRFSALEPFLSVKEV